MTLRPAAQILLIEGAAIRPLLEATDEAAFDRPTVCDGWSVRDVIAHCAAALTRTASSDLHDFSPEQNQRDVDARRNRSSSELLAELTAGYQDASGAIDAAGGALDGIGLGEWMHGGDIREALDLPAAYASEGVDLAVDLLVERSARMGKPAVTVELPAGRHDFGVGIPMGVLRCDTATFVRLCGGRRPDPERYVLTGDATAADLVLFS